LIAAGLYHADEAYIEFLWFNTLC